jgi:hypothetical protein
MVFETNSEFFIDLVDPKDASLESESIVLIDKEDNDNNNAWIKVEYRHVGSDSNSRASDSTFKKNNVEFFDKYMDTYNTLLNNAKLYDC